MIKTFYGETLEEVIEAVNSFENATGQRIQQFKDFEVPYASGEVKYGMIVAFRGPDYYQRGEYRI